MVTMGSCVAERPGTPRGPRAYGMADLSAAAFEFDFDPELQSDDDVCTLHSAWTEAEAAAAYERPVWECSDRFASTEGGEEEGRGVESGEGEREEEEERAADDSHAQYSAQRACALTAPAVAVGAQPKQSAPTKQLCEMSPACVELASCAFWDRAHADRESRANALK